MAKFIIEHEIHVGDFVAFRGGDDNKIRLGFVQDISQLPDVFIEGFQDLKYTRWRVGINSIEEIRNSEYDSGVHTRTEIADGEVVERTRQGEIGTEEFNKYNYRYHKHNKI